MDSRTAWHWKIIIYKEFFDLALGMILKYFDLAHSLWHWFAHSMTLKDNNLEKYFDLGSTKNKTQFIFLIQLGQNQFSISDWSLKITNENLIPRSSYIVFTDSSLTQTINIRSVKKSKNNYIKYWLNKLFNLLFWFVI